ncbi:hypothetical protein F511_44102 [Dorcoceras hygrometricum]|uniref:Uncharacterized protein n=1 Tax=Dorcoceras hygrometricum TaxID=472368 RepID=A0A2Z7CW71_9LAMI|nr:hypothetical protein F511_44102 [Dorcoceras hygrometricum]
MGWRNDRRTVDAVLRAGCVKEAETPPDDACMIARRAADRLLPCCAQLLRDYGRCTLLHHCAAGNMVVETAALRPPSYDDLRQIVATAEFYF